MTAYYLQTRITPHVLLRRRSYVDQAWNPGTGEWMPTKWIVDWMFGHDDDVEEITEERARAIAPEAF